MTSRIGGDARDAGGFTLIEVLVATVAVLAGIVAILGVFGRAVSVLDESASAIRADSLLREKMAEVEESIGMRRGLPSDSAGGFPHPNEAFRWQMEVRPVALAGSGGSKRLKGIVLSVGKGSSHRRYSVSTYVGEHGD